MNLLDKYDKQGRLTWHDGAIPDDEIWVKIGGDHGGGSFKLMLQIANLHNPNSKFNTCLIQMVECKDSAENLRRLLGPMRDELSSLKSMKWRGKQLKLFVFGDYEFLTKLYGLSGAQATHPCLYCTASKCQIHAPPAYSEGNIMARTLPQIRADYRSFCRAKKKKTAAKLCNNVIWKPFLQIELDQVAPPYLHILLGVVKKHHDLLEKDCHNLDKDVAKWLASTDDSLQIDGTSEKFQRYVQQLSTRAKRRTAIRKLKARAANTEDNSVKATALAKIEGLKKVNSLTIEPLKMLSGPVTANLDSTLQEHRICTQPYHGRSLVGNHCNKYVKSPVYENICGSVVTKTKQLTQCKALQRKADHICGKFTTLYALFGDVHRRIGHQNPMTESEIEEAENSIKTYMAFYREQFPRIQIIPKQHLLEAHCMPWLRRWGIGLALHGEQGGEETHATVNSLKRRVWGIRCPQQRLKVLMTEHLTIVSPYFHGLTHLRAKKTI